MNTLKAVCNFCFIGFLTVGLLSSQGCTSQAESTTEDPCVTTKSECLGIINQNSDEIARVLRATYQAKEPSVVDVLSSLAFFAQLEEKEAYLKSTCPAIYEEYVSQRDVLVVLLIGREAVR